MVANEQQWTEITEKSNMAAKIYFLNRLSVITFALIYCLTSSFCKQQVPAPNVHGCTSGSDCWNRDSADDGTRILTRKKRSLTFPEGSSLQLGELRKRSLSCRQQDKHLELLTQKLGDAFASASALRPWIIHLFISLSLQAPLPIKLKLNRYGSLERDGKMQKCHLEFPLNKSWLNYWKSPFYASWFLVCSPGSEQEDGNFQSIRIQCSLHFFMHISIPPPDSHHIAFQYDIYFGFLALLLFAYAVAFTTA